MRSFQILSAFTKIAAGVLPDDPQERDVMLDQIAEQKKKGARLGYEAEVADIDADRLMAKTKKLDEASKEQLKAEKVQEQAMKEQQKQQEELAKQMQPPIPAMGGVPSSPNMGMLAPQGMDAMSKVAARCESFLKAHVPRFQKTAAKPAFLTDARRKQYAPGLQALQGYKKWGATADPTLKKGNRMKAYTGYLRGQGRTTEAINKDLGAMRKLRQGHQDWKTQQAAGRINMPSQETMAAKAPAAAAPGNQAFEQNLLAGRPTTRAERENANKVFTPPAPIIEAKLPKPPPVAKSSPNFQTLQSQGNVSAQRADKHFAALDTRKRNTQFWNTFANTTPRRPAPVHTLDAPTNEEVFNKSMFKRKNQFEQDWDKRQRYEKDIGINF